MSIHMPFDFLKSWFSSSEKSSPPLASSSSLSASSMLQLIEQVEIQDVAAASNVGLLCWTIYLARQLSKRTTQEVEKSVMQQTNRSKTKKDTNIDTNTDTNTGTDNINTETIDTKTDKGTESNQSSVNDQMAKKKKVSEYSIVSHVWTLVGVKEGAACFSVAALLCLRTFCDLRMIRYDIVDLLMFK